MERREFETSSLGTVLQESSTRIKISTESFFLPLNFSVIVTLLTKRCVLMMRSVSLIKKRL